MATFKLEMFTPRKQFFSGDVESIVINGLDGERGIMAGHTPMIAALAPGKIRIKVNGEWNEAYNSDGFMEVRPDEVLIFSHSCIWPKEIDEDRARREYEAKTEQLRNAESLSEHRSAEIALQRITAMLSVKNKNNINNL